LAGGALSTTGDRTSSSAPIANPIDVQSAGGTITTTATASVAVNLNLSSNSIGGTGTLTFANNPATTAVFQPRFTGSGVNFNAPTIVLNGTGSGSVLLQSFNTTGTLQNFPNTISGNGSMRRTSSSNGAGGESDFSGANTYSGGMSLADGTLGLGSSSTGTSGPLGVGALTVTPNAPSSVNVLTALGANRSIDNAINFTAPIANDAPLVVSGSNGLTMTGAVDLGGVSRTIQTDSTGATEFTNVITGTGAGLTKTGAGALKFSGANAYVGGTTVNAGTLIANHSQAFANGALTVADGATAQVQSGLANAVVITTLNTNTSGQMDVTNGSMVIRGSTGDAVRAQIVSGFNGGAWNGPGINSSTAAADSNGLTAVGYAANSDYGASDFKGVSGLNASDVLLRYTYYGDADLDGTVTLDDFSQFLNGYQTQSAATNNWLNGDFDYDGAVTLDDFSQFLFGYQHQGAPLGALESMIESSGLSSSDKALMLAAVEAVPEPTGLGLLGLAGAGLLGRRNRSRRK
jgi:autotransporter-associated beta strand protein